MSSSALPHWDMTSIFPSLSSPEFREALENARVALTDLAEYFDEWDVRKRSQGRVDETVVEQFETATHWINTLLRDMRVVGSYVNCFVTTDANNDLAQSTMAEIRAFRVQFSQLHTRYVAWVGSLDLAALLQHSQVARDHEFALRQIAVDAAHQMSEAEENLAAELQPMGLSGWARLHGDMTALLTVDLTLHGERKTLPMSEIRSLANDPDRETRRAAYEAELEAWKGVQVPLAAALNGIKGFQGVMHRRRGWNGDVAPTLHDEGIDAETLDAMQTACVESFPDFRRYMHAKARALGLERLTWYDVTAPVGSGNRSYTWEEAEGFIREQFGRYSARMAEFADRTFQERWIDAEPRPGKEGGAYCTSLHPGISRIMMNYDGSFNNVSTLAHELGHAYHNLNLKDRTPLQKMTPSSLAETASIFCETLALEAAMKGAAPAERLALLEGGMQRDLMVVVDIHSRFLFEKRAFEARRKRDLTPREFCELMLQAQEETYGDGLDPERRHPYMWAVKGHYYGPTFYNYPYTFGLLFGLGLYARYREDPDGFRGGYDDLLSSTGLADAATLAARFGINTRGIEFWRSSLDVIRGNIAEFERLAGTAA